ncbi:glutamyl-tRNA(Gln) amidotransferase subunit B, mitochondrial [Neocloeon triangulifer]|uniref:glutamyl-tRNA(Gln) amidotransferase subunit B, mitochondrial n=1 Tax=Neocloeon triangulifer TaxID=2078957 RepID=UPI00286FAE2B|nr:glutamyl-tRNA(Gln) amidotransferase subunit B, mitochondrial [Neocloeon triangulifer]
MHRSLKSYSVRRAINFCRFQHSKTAAKSEEVSEWKGVVGLEIHAQISTKSKLFSRAGTEFACPVNNNVALFDAAIPGTLPVINRGCVESAVMTALALECEINPASTFDRKHYFYADMPAGYQITQQRNALAHNGVLRFYVNPPSGKPYLKSSKLKQLQLEQDSGKSLHDVEGCKSLVDLNRAGVGLMELVFEPDLSDGEEAASLVKELALILQRLKTCSCKMEEGAFRVDANVSVQRVGSTTLGPRTEIKNINSVRGVANAVNWEIKRQIKANLKNERIVVETRSYDAKTKTTVPMRDKEEKQDYRFMPEPNLPPLRLRLKESEDGTLIAIPDIKQKIPELPEKSREKLLQSFNLATIHAINLVNEDFLLDLFYTVASKVENPQGRVIYELIFTGLLTLLKQNDLKFHQNPISIENMVELYNLLASREISVNTLILVLEILKDNPQSTPRKIVEDNSWYQISDPEDLRKICVAAIAENPKKVKSFLKGKKNSFGSFVTLVAKMSDNRADLFVVTTILTELLEKEKAK